MMIGLDGYCLAIAVYPLLTMPRYIVNGADLHEQEHISFGFCSGHCCAAGHGYRQDA